MYLFFVESYINLLKVCWGKNANINNDRNKHNCVTTILWHLFHATLLVTGKIAFKKNPNKFI